MLGLLFFFMRWARHITVIIMWEILLASSLLVGGNSIKINKALVENSDTAGQKH